MEHINTEITDASKRLYSELILINSMKTYFETFFKLGKEYLYVVTCLAVVLVTFNIFNSFL